MAASFSICTGQNLEGILGSSLLLPTPANSESFVDHHQQRIPLLLSCPATVYFPHCRQKSSYKTCQTMLHYLLAQNVLIMSLLIQSKSQRLYSIPQVPACSACFPFRPHLLLLCQCPHHPVLDTPSSLLVLQHVRQAPILRSLCVLFSMLRTLNL